MIEWLFTFLVFYLLYKLIFDFILPVSRASSQIKSKMNQMHQQQQNTMHQQQQNHYDSSKATQQTKARPPADEYIDYEEVK
jgi:hypothetical protein